jgi:predicted nucleic acid-binding protein
VKHFVLDASIALSWFIDHPIAPHASHVRELLRASHAIVPPLWHVEVVNGLLVAERHGNLNPADTEQSLELLEIIITQAIETQDDIISRSRILNTARQFGLTAYDAVYLDIARELQLPLATLDRQLAKAATKAGVPLMH